MADDSNEKPVPSPTVDKTVKSRGRWLAPFSIVALLAAFVGSQLVGALLFAFFASLAGWSDGKTEEMFKSTTGMFAYLLVSEALLIAIIFGLMKGLRWGWTEIGLIKPRLKHLVGGVVAALPYYVLLISVVKLITMFVPALDIEQKQDVGFNNVAGSLELTLTFLALVVIVPLAEEIAVRGFLYTGVRRAMPKLAAAVVVSSAFALLHLFGGEGGQVIWVAAIDTFILSLVLIWLRERTGNLWAGILLHATKNFIAFLGLYIFSGL